MAGHLRSGAGRAIIVAALALGSVGSAAAAEPSTAPARPTCAERFPADGPAGVDLRLGCLVSEVVGTFTGTTVQGDPAPLSSYLEPLLAVALAIAGAVLALVLARRLLGRRLAPVLSAEWWRCTACRSVNPTVASRCYACGAIRPAAAETLSTAPPGEPSGR